MDKKLIGTKMIIRRFEDVVYFNTFNPPKKQWV